MDAEAPPLPSVPGFELVRLLGRGAQGAVYLARTADALRREVAVKVFAPDGVAGFARELETWRAIEAIRARGGPGGTRGGGCPPANGAGALVEGIGAGELAGGGAYVAMAYQPLGSVADLLRRDGPLAEPRALAIAARAAEALALLHESGIVHRDVKPSNLLVRSEAPGDVCLADFGLSRAGDASFSAAGTPGFCAPELYSGAPLAGPPRATIDVYSLAATLHALLTGYPPRPGHADIFALERAGVTRPVQRAITRGLAGDPAERFESVLAFRAALEGAGGAADGARAAPRRPLRRAALALAVVAAVAAVGVPVALARRKATEPAAAPAPPSRLVVSPPVRKELVDDGYVPAISTAPSSAIESLALGWYAFHMNDDKLARSAAEHALALAPDLSEALVLRGSVLYRSGEEEAAKPDLERAVALGTRIVDAYYLLGDLYLRAGEGRRTLECAERARTIAPDDPGPLDLLGDARFALGDWKGALSAADAVLELRPGDDRALSCRGDALEKLGRRAEMLEAYRAALAHPAAKSRLDAEARAAMRRKIAETEAGAVTPTATAPRLGTAVVGDLPGIPSAPADALASLALGWYAFHAGQFELAKKSAGDALRRAPDLAEALVLRGAIEYEFGDHAKAKPDLERAVALETGIVDAYYLLGSIYVEDGDADRGLALLNEAIEMHPSNPEALSVLATSRAKLKDWKGALETADRLLAVAPGDARGHLVRGRALDGLGRRDEATAAYRRAAAVPAEESSISPETRAQLLRRLEMATPTPTAAPEAPPAPGLR